MSDTLQGLHRKIFGAGELQSVVRTMKVLAAASIGQYERAVLSLADYHRTVQLGLVACLREAEPDKEEKDEEPIGAVVFGSDQGLVGQFNDVLAEFVAKEFGALPGKKMVWAVGERIHARLGDAGLPPEGLFAVPNSVAGITGLVGQILTEAEEHRAKGDVSQIYIFHYQPKPGAVCEPTLQRLLPLDAQWRAELDQIVWPTRQPPQVLVQTALLAFIREYLFVSLFKACAESLASENASRLAAMQRAEKNIEELLENLTLAFHRLRQSSIDEELFDVISGFEALS
jgi:F-type H+-transporting ATPase subunit gamma